MLWKLTHQNANVSDFRWGGTERELGGCQKGNEKTLGTKENVYKWQVNE